MSVKPDALAAPPDPAAEAEPKKDALTEAWDKAVKEVGEGAAPEDAPATETEDEPAAEAEPESKEEGPQEEEEEPAAEPSFYTKAELDAMKPGDLIHLDLKRVPPELRGIIGAARKALAQGFQEIADAKKEGKPDSAKSEPKEVPEGFTEAEWDEAMNSPEGLTKAVDGYLARKFPALLKNAGLDPERSIRQSAADNLGDALDAAASGEKGIKQLADPEFRSVVLQTLHDEGMAGDLEEAAKKGDVAKATRLIRGAAGLALPTYKPKAADKPKPGDKATKAEAELSASAASRSTSRGSQPKEGGMTLDRAWDDAEKKVGAGAFR